MECPGPGLGLIAWGAPVRHGAIHTPEGTRQVASIARSYGVDALLLIRDEDDACPRETAPAQAAWLEAERLPFPSAVTLMYREYEVLFLACIEQLAGAPLRDARGVERPGLRAGITLDRDPESVRDAKGWLTAHLPKNRGYKPTIDQLPLTRMLDLDALRAAKLPSFIHLERALRFLDAPGAGEPLVYPPPGPGGGQRSS